MIDFVKKCPKCGCEQKYKSRITYERAVNTNTLCKKCATIGRYVKNNVSVLLNEELETYYWIGFILADGTITNDGRLRVRVSRKDITHVEKLAKYISTELKITKSDVGVNAMNKQYIPVLCNKFDIKNHKTYNPPDVNKLKLLENNKILSIIIGFIDGDGSIKNVWNRKDYNIQIKNHNSWLSILEYFSEVITGKNLAKINSNGYASLIISNNLSIIKLKKFALENNLPILDRKWDIIDINFVNRTFKSNQKKDNIIKLLNEGKNISEISQITGIKYMTVYQIIKRNKLK